MSAGTEVPGVSHCDSEVFNMRDASHAILNSSTDISQWHQEHTTTFLSDQSQVHGMAFKSIIGKQIIPDDHKAQKYVSIFKSFYGATNPCSDTRRAKDGFSTWPKNRHKDQCTTAGFCICSAKADHLNSSFPSITKKKTPFVNRSQHWSNDKVVPRSLRILFHVKLQKLVKTAMW